MAEDATGAIVFSEETGAIVFSDELSVRAEDDGAIGDSLDDGVMTSDITDEASEAIELMIETTGVSDDEDGAADDELTTDELDDGVTGATGVGVPRLKIQMRPTITMTATMMIIQVLRFMGFALGWRRPDRGVLS